MSDSQRYRWTEESIALLGAMKDQDVADKLGLHLTTVCRYRNKLGIPPFHRHRWDEEEIDLLYSPLSQKAVARQTGKSVSQVYSMRRKLGIPSPFQQHNPRRKKTYSKE